MATTLYIGSNPIVTNAIMLKMPCKIQYKTSTLKCFKKGANVVVNFYQVI